MRILCTEFSCAPYFIFRGWQNVLEAAGHQWTWWKKDKSAFDIFSEVNPDVFIGTTYNLDRATIKCITNRPNLKVVLKGNNWGPSDRDIDKTIYPIGIADQKEKDIVLELKQKTGKPDLVCNYYHKNRMEYTMGDWDTNGITTIDMQPAADLYSLFPLAKPVESLKSDIAFVGGYWGYKSRNMDKYLLPLCTPVGKYNVKLFGNQLSPYPQYIGYASESLTKSLYSSSTICPNINEPHATDYGFELNHRVFQLAASRAFCIHDPVSSLSDVFTNNEMVVGSTPEHFEDLVKLYLRSPDSRLDSIDNCFNTVISNHTYHHRVSNLLSILGYDTTRIRQEYTKVTNRDWNI